MTDPYKKGYSRGYQTGLAGRWPEHKPPLPMNDPVTAELIGALQNLRDEIDGQLATFDPDDQLNVKLSPAIDRATAALEAVTRWLKEPT